MTTHLPLFLCCVWVFLLGLGIGSFLNVLIARLPFEKSVIWPGSRCFTCKQPLRLWDNLPVVGYLLRRGRCRNCGATFSARYLWVELGTAAAFVLLFVLEIGGQSDTPGWLRPLHLAPGLKHAYYGGPPLAGWLYFAGHATLLALLIAAAAIDAEHRIIPPQITYVGTVLGILVSTAFPWPWPTDPGTIAIPAGTPWILPEAEGKIPVGVCLWPAWGPPPAWAPAGTWKLGLLNGLVGAAAGMFVGRAIKFVFELALGKEALGLGDADLLMMAGAFLGWQPAALALPIGAVVTLPVILAMRAFAWVRGRPLESELPFGPGIAAGVVVTWLGWSWAGGFARMLYDPVVLVFLTVVMGGGMLVAGLLIRRPAVQPER